MSIKDRLLELIANEGINNNQFYERTGLANGFIDKIGNQLRKSSIEKIKNTFPYWNIKYITDGTGWKYIYDDEQIVNIFDFNHFLSNNRLTIETLKRKLVADFSLNYLRDVSKHNIDVSLNLFNELIDVFGFDVVSSSFYKTDRIERSPYEDDSILDKKPHKKPDIFNNQSDGIFISNKIFEQISRLTETVLSQQRTIEMLAGKKTDVG